MNVELQQNSSHLQGWSIGLRGVQPLTPTVQAPAPRVPRNPPTVLPDQQPVLPDHNLFLSKLNHAKRPVCRSLPLHHPNPWRIAPARVPPRLSQFTLTKLPSKNTPRNFLHCGAHRYQIWRRCQSLTRKLVKPLNIDNSGTALNTKIYGKPHIVMSWGGFARV